MDSKLLAALAKKFRKIIGQFFKAYYLADDVALRNSASDIHVLIESLRKNKNIFRSRKGVKYLLALYNYAATSYINIDVSSDISNIDKQNYILHVAVWGEDYLHKLMTYMIPSLLARNNVPALHKKYRMRLAISCDSKSAETLQNSPIISLASQYMSVHYEIIPTEIFVKLSKAMNWFAVLFAKIIKHNLTWKYALLGMAQNQWMIYAQTNKCLISFLLPDMAFSDNTFLHLSDEISKGVKAVGATAFRSAFQSSKKVLESHVAGQVLNISGAELTRIIVENMHVAAQARIVSSKNRQYTLCPQIIFSYPDCLVIRSFHYHPMLVNFAAINKHIAPNYDPIDNRLLCAVVDSSMPIEKQIYINEDSAYITIMEISNESIEKIRFNPVAIDLIKLIREYVNKKEWSDPYKYFLSKRCKFVIQKNKYILSDVLDVELIN